MILAQEMRPKTFDEVIGNEHIVEPLRRQIENGTLSQSLMLTGATGTGKSSLAAIIARELKADVHEVDCGSDGGIDTIRNVIESAQHSSLFADNKVFILDEAHKLSTASQSALLRTLEEQREGVYFILLTNEPNKVLKTIRTRCVVYETSVPGNKEIGIAVNRVLEKYGLEVENKKDFWKLIEQAEGSLRQVYSLLEKLLSVDDEGFISSEAFHRALQALPDEEEESNLARAFKAGRTKDTLLVIKELQRNGGVNATSSGFGVYNYLKAVYLGGAEVNTPLLSALAAQLSSKVMDWIDLERLAWEYLKS